MGRYLSDPGFVGVPGKATPSPSNPITGVFGRGFVEVISATKTFIAPSESVRVRLWGGGGKGNGPSNGVSGGGGGGFALKVINGLTVGQSILVTVGGESGTSSFGAFVSATGGETPPSGGSANGGTGVGGDFNASGGKSYNSSAENGGGGAGSIFGKGGDANPAIPGENAGSGGGGGSLAANSYTNGGSGFTGLGGTNESRNGGIGPDNIDFIGTGGGGYADGNGGNGGGGGCRGNGGFPGGGGGFINSRLGARGLVIVEW